MSALVSTTATKNGMDPKLYDAIEMSKASLTSNRGMYPHTKAANVFKEDGTPLEDISEDDPEV